MTQCEFSLLNTLASDEAIPIISQEAEINFALNTGDACMSGTWVLPLCTTDFRVG